MTATIIDMEKLFLQRRLCAMLKPADMPGFLSLLTTMQLADRLSPGIVGNWTPPPETRSFDGAVDSLHNAVYSALATPANDPIPTA